MPAGSPREEEFANEEVDMTFIKGWRLLVVLAVSVATLLFASLAVLATSTPTSESGGSLVGIQVARDTGAQNLNTTSFSNLSGAAVSLRVSAGTRYLVLATFSAESRCDGPNNSFCSIRIVAVPSGGSATSLHPKSGTDYAFDSPGDAPGTDWEGHSVQRSIRLSGGSNGRTYTIRVQGTLQSGATNFALDDWHLTVERFRA
jgi:hypothetical protein